MWDPIIALRAENLPVAIFIVMTASPSYWVGRQIGKAILRKLKIHP